MILAFDVDGTLYDGESVAPEAVEAIEAAVADGNVAVIVSGRPWDDLQRIIADDLPTISLTTNVALIAKVKTLKNFVPNPTNMTNFVNTSGWYMK